MDKYEKLRYELFQILGYSTDEIDNVVFSDENIISMVKSLKNKYEILLKSQCSGVGNPFKVMFTKDENTGLYNCNRLNK